MSVSRITFKGLEVGAFMFIGVYFKRFTTVH